MISEPPLDAPDEEWLVWADAMQQLGDPRGELIALAQSPRRDAFAKKHADALLGPVLGRHVRKGDCRITSWRRCYADAVEVRVDAWDIGPQLVVDTLGAVPKLRSLTVAGLGAVASEPLNLAPTLGWLREAQLPPTLTSLALVDDRARAVDHLISRTYQAGPNLVVFGPLAELWSAFHQLEHLHMVVADPGQIQFAVIRLPALQSFTLHALRWAEGLGDLLANSQWPRLRSLELRLTETFRDNDPDDARAYAPVYRFERERHGIGGDLVTTNWRVELDTFLDSIRGLPLERLALTSFQNASAVLDALEAAELPETLVELDLSGSVFERPDAERLRRSPLQRFQQIVVDKSRRVPTHRYIVGME